MKKLVLSITASILALTAVSLISLGMYFASLFNQAKTLEVTYLAKVEANKTDFDNTVKVISQTAQVSKSQLDKLREIYVSYADARTSDSAGAVMNWVQESVPNVDTTTMNNLQNIIVSSRNNWTERQKELVDVSREFNTLLATFPNNVLLGSIAGFKPINPQIVTSTRTTESFSTGKDDDVNLNF